MPYGRRRYGNFRRTRNTYGGRYRSRFTSPSFRAMRTVARSEIRRDNNKDHPLQWVDILFTGGNVNTTPTMHSLVLAIRDREIASGSYIQWPKHNTGSDLTDFVYQGKYQVSYIRYQLRYQQDAATIESTNTFRMLLYSYNFTNTEDSTPILDGLDVDQPPRTEYVVSMFSDRIATVRAISTGDISGTDDAGPGTRILKGQRRLRNNFTFVCNEAGANPLTDAGDIRWESQSDTVGDGLQLFGFIRVYYRRLQ